MTPQDPRHGTAAGYDAHRRAGQQACPACRAGAAAYEGRLRTDRILGRARTVPALGSARRVQALVALGYSYRDLSDALGVEHDLPRKWAHASGTIRTSSARRIARVYRDLCMTPPPQRTRAERHRAAYARAVARRYGWVPPLAWDDIDTDPEPPAADDRDDYDEAVVLRVLAGEWHLPTTHADRAEIAARWVASGRSTYALRQIVGWKVERYFMARSSA